MSPVQTATDPLAAANAPGYSTSNSATIRCAFFKSPPFLIMYPSCKQLGPEEVRVEAALERPYNAALLTAKLFLLRCT